MHARRLAHSSLAAARRPSRRDGMRALSAGVAQLAEHLFCKQVVGGSSPPASSNFILGGLPERPKGAGCKPAGIAYVGSNPTPSTVLLAFSQGVGASSYGRPVASGQGFVFVGAGFGASRLGRSLATRCRVRRFVVGGWVSVDDRDLVFQDSRGVAGSACASRVFSGLAGSLRILSFLGLPSRQSRLLEIARPERFGRSDRFQREGRFDGPGAAVRNVPLVRPELAGAKSGDRLGGRLRAAGVFVGVAGVVAGMGHNRRLARGGGSSGLPLRVPRGSSSIGRASAFQAERRGFESLLPLYNAPTARRIGWPT